MHTPDKQEFAIKLKRLRAFLSKEGYDAALMGTAANFSWLSCGGKNKVLLNTDFGVSVLLVTQERLVCVANTMDARRLAEQELAGLGFELDLSSGRPIHACEKLAGGVLLWTCPLGAGPGRSQPGFCRAIRPGGDPATGRWAGRREVLRRSPTQPKPGRRTWRPCSSRSSRPRS
jgi:hypothetical protein